MQKPRLRLTTPVTRIANLSRIESEDTELLKAPDYFDAEWHVMIDCDTLGLDPQETHWTSALPWCRVENVAMPRQGPRHGEDLYNPLMDVMDADEWHYGFGDDSLLTPGFIKALRDAIDHGADAVLFTMQPKGLPVCKAVPTNIQPGVVSGGALAFRRSVAGDLRWKNGSATLDGVFVRDIWNQTKDTHKWTMLDEPVLLSNQLR